MAFDIDIGSDDQPDTGFDIVIGSTATTAVALGDTIDALNAGSLGCKWVAAIGGCPYLLTDADTGRAVEAWDGLDWEMQLGGLFVDLQNEQVLNPWDPFPRGGKLTLRVAPDADDTFGILTHRKKGGAESELVDTLSPGENATIQLLSASTFAASGTVYIGTEAIGYDSKTATDLETLERGKWSPFAATGLVGTSRWATLHEVSTDPNSIPIPPRVTELGRQWRGRWVGLWMHLVDQLTGALNTRDEARLVFAGRIVDGAADDPSTMTTTIACEHVLDYAKRAVLGRDMWSAKVKDGMYLTAGMKFNFRDTDDGGATPWNFADELEVVPSGAVGTTQVNAGFYSPGEIYQILNSWLTAQRVAANIVGDYNVGRAPWNGDGMREHTYFSYRIPSGAGDVAVNFKLEYPRAVSKFFGKLEDAFPGNHAILFAEPGSVANTNYDRVSVNVPLRMMVTLTDAQDPTFQTLPRLEVYDESGRFFDQIGDLPGAPPYPGGFDIGLVVFSTKHTAYVAKDGDQLRGIVGAPINYSGTQPIGDEFFNTLSIPFDADQNAPITVKQALFRHGPAKTVIKEIFYSTTGEAYNSNTYDRLPFGVGIPGELLGENFDNSVDALPGADSEFTLIIDEPTKLADLLAGALVYRWSFLRWKDEGLQFAAWNTPTAGVALTESNKAAPVENSEDHRTASMETAEHQKSTIKVDYDRDFTAVQKDGGFRSSKTFVDPGAIDDAGGDNRVVTLPLRESYGTDGVEALRAGFMATAPLFTHDITKQNRSIDSTLWEQIAIGDTVLATDEFARDPDTGRRGVAARPGIVLEHRWSPGGAGPNKTVADMMGEVVVMFMPALTVAPYVPTAQLDEGAANAGYDVGTKVLTCHAHKFSEASEAADATNFRVGAGVRILEMDPADPDAPSVHNDVIDAQAGNTITLQSGFGTFDNTKRYIVILTDYVDSEAEEQAGYSWQADATDGMVADDRVPFQYSQPAQPLGAFTGNSADDPVTLPANITHNETDGSGRDVGTDVALNRLINNLHDYKTAISAPCIHATELSGAGVSGTWKLVDVRNLNLTGEKLSPNALRSLIVAPMFKSSDGTDAEVRVSVCRTRPIDDSFDDVDRGALCQDATFSTSLTDHHVPASQSISLVGIKTTAGHVYILIECSEKARCMGLAICQEGPRQ